MRHTNGERAAHILFLVKTAAGSSCGCLNSKSEVLGDFVSFRPQLHHLVKMTPFFAQTARTCCPNEKINTFRSMLATFFSLPVLIPCIPLNQGSSSRCGLHSHLILLLPAWLCNSEFALEVAWIIIFALLASITSGVLAVWAVLTVLCC